MKEDIRYATVKEISKIYDVENPAGKITQTAFVVLTDNNNNHEEYTGRAYAAFCKVKVGDRVKTVRAKSNFVSIEADIIVQVMNKKPGEI